MKRYTGKKKRKCQCLANLHAIASTIYNQDMISFINKHIHAYCRVDWLIQSCLSILFPPYTDPINQNHCYSRDKPSNVIN